MGAGVWLCDHVEAGRERKFNPFTAEVAIMRLLGSTPMSHLCDQKRRSKVTGLSDLMTLFVDLWCLYCKQMQRAFNVFKNTVNWLKIDSVDRKFNWLECGNFSQDAGTLGTERVIAFSQLAVKGLSVCVCVCVFLFVCFFFFYKLYEDREGNMFVVMVKVKSEKDFLLAMWWSEITCAEFLFAITYHHNVCKKRLLYECSSKHCMVYLSGLSWDRERSKGSVINYLLEKGVCV
jgi:hypothetical protein